MKIVKIELIFFILFLLIPSLSGCASATKTQLGPQRIETGGEYEYTGVIESSIIIDAGEEIVNIILNNAYISPTGGPAIDVKSAGAVTIIIPENTNSSLSDTAAYSDGEKGKGCISSASDVHFEGNGTLNVSGYHENGIDCKDHVSIENTSIFISTKGDGINANDGLTIENGDLRVEAEGNGLTTTKSGKGKKGRISINGSSINIISGKYGIKAKTDLDIHGSKVIIKSILGDYTADGITSIEEGCIAHE